MLSHEFYVTESASEPGVPAELESANLRQSRSKPWAPWTRQLANSCQSGKKDLLNIRRWQRRSFSVPESFCAGAVLQCCLLTWHIASPCLHGLMICTQLYIILIFKLPRENIYRG